MKRRSCLTGLLVLVVAPALSQTQAQAQIDCSKTLNTQLEMNQCAQQEFKTADAALNTAYRKVMRGRNAAEKKALRKAQRTWITYRDQACESYASAAEGGSMQPQLFNICRQHLTKERTEFLRIQDSLFNG